ncbi:MAG: nuclear transport factor 2 family protein, partial [Actinomycetota bacterium]
MDRESLIRWVEGYRRAWESNDRGDVEALFTPHATYYTEPFRDGIKGRDAIVADWLNRKDEPGDTEFRYEIRALCDGIGFVRGWAKYFTEPQREYSNLWEVRLDDEGRCV